MYCDTVVYHYIRFPNICIYTCSPQTRDSEYSIIQNEKNVVLGLIFVNNLSKKNLWTSQIMFLRFFLL